MLETSRHIEQGSFRRSRRRYRLLKEVGPHRLDDDVLAAVFIDPDAYGGILGRLFASSRSPSPSDPDPGVVSVMTLMLASWFPRRRVRRAAGGWSRRSGATAWQRGALIVLRHRPVMSGRVRAGAGDGGVFEIAAQGLHPRPGQRHLNVNAGSAGPLHDMVRTSQICAPLGQPLRRHLLLPAPARHGVDERN